MTMVVNSRQLASMTSSFLDKNHGNLARGLTRLSSGIRFATAADDAGNLAVSVKLNSSLKRSSVIHKNIQNARSFLSMQEDAYKGLGKIIDRMSELRTLFDDPIKTWSDKKNLNFEFKELQQEVMQMSRAKLNGVSLFSTEDQSKFPFYLPTGDSGSRVHVTRTGFFDNVGIMSAGVGTTPNFTVSGNIGSMSNQPFLVSPQGTAPDTNFDAIQGTMSPEAFAVGMSQTPTALNNVGATPYDAKPIVRIRDNTGAEVAQVDATAITLNGDGTLSIDLSTLPAGVSGAGSYTVKADDGAIYLDPVDVTNLNQGSGYLAVPGSTVLAPDGSVATDISANLTLTGDKLTVTATGTPTQLGDYTIQIDDGPLSSDKASISSSLTTDGLYQASGAKPTVRVFDNTGTEVSTVASGNVTLNANGTVSIDLTALPPSVVAGVYTLKADDGTGYLDPNDLVTNNVGSGYGAVPGLSILAPDGTVNPGDVTAALALSGDKLNVTASGTPLQVGTYKVQIDDGPLTSDKTDVTSSLTTDGLYDAGGAKPISRIFNNLGVEIAQAAPADVTVNANGTVSIDLTSLPAAVNTAGAGAYTVKADNGAAYLDPADLVTNNVGSGYGALPAFSVIAPDGTVNPGDVTAALVLAGDKVNVTASGTPLQVGTYKVQIEAGPLSSNLNSVSSSATTDTPYDAKPAVKIYDGTGAVAGTVSASDVTLNANGTVTVDLSTLPGGVTPAGTYDVKADDGAIYIDPTTTPLTNVGSGYTALPSSVTITGPGTTPTVVTQDPATAITVDGATFNFTLAADKLNIVTAGTPTKVGDFTIQIADGPLSSDTATITSDDTTDGLFVTEPAVQIYDNTGAAVGTVPGAAVNLNAGPAPTAGTVSIDLSDPATLATAGVVTAGTYTVKADDGLKLSSTTLTIGDTSYTALPSSVTIEGPSGASISGDPASGAIGSADGVSIASVTLNGGKLDVVLSGTPTVAGNFIIKAADGPSQGSLSQTEATIRGTSTTEQVTTSVIADPTQKTATKLWETLTPNVASADVDTRVVMSSSGTLFFISGEGGPAQVHSVNSTDGSENWVANLTTDTQASPALSSDESVLYIGDTGGNLTALNTSNGNELWSFDTGNTDDIRTKPALSPDGSTVYFGSRDDNLYAVNTADGSLKWTFNANGNIDSSPVVDAAGVIYFGSNSNHTYAVQDNGANASQIWRTQHSFNADVRSSPALSNDGSRLYIGDARGRLTAYDTSNGNRQWQTGLSFTNPINTDIAVGSNDNIYFIGANDRLEAYQDNGGSATRLGRFDVGTAGSRSSPVVNSSNRVFITSDSGALFALDGADPSTWGNSTNLNGVIWTGQMGDSSDSTPALSADGSIAYVGSDDNKLYAFTDPASGFKLDATSVEVGQNYLATDTVNPSDISLSGTAAAGITVSSTSIANGKVTVNLAGTPTSAGTIDILIKSTAEGSPYLDYMTEVGSGFAAGLDPSTLTVSITPDNSLGNAGIIGFEADGVTPRVLTGTVQPSSVTLTEGGNTYTGGINAGTGALKLITFTGSPEVGGDFLITVNGPATGTASDTTVATAAITMAAQSFVVAPAGTAADQKVTTLQGTMAAQSITVAPTGSVQTVNVDSLQGTMASQGFNVAAAGTAPDVDLDAFRGTMAAQGFTLAPDGTAADVKVTAIQGTMPAENLTVGIMATPNSVTGGSDYASKPVVKLYDNTGAELATVNAADVTLNGNGTVSVDLSTLPAAVNAAGNYTAKAEDGPLYIDPTDTPATNVGSGYAAVPTLDVVAPDGTLNPGDVTAALTLVGDKLTVTASGTPTQKGIYKVQIADGPLSASTTSITAGTGYDASETPVTTISDSTGAAVGTTTVTNNGDGTLTIDLSTLPAGLTAAGNYTAKSANGTIATTPSPVNVGSGYNPSDPAPSVTITGGPAGTLSIASTAINPDGSVGISFAGNPSGSGPVSISVGSGGSSSQIDGLTNEDLDLWDFSMSDFTRYIQVLANVRSVNGSESSSFNFSERLLTKNFENLEMASSRITDTDVASEMVKVAKYRIKTSTAADMLAKHNNLSSMVDLTVMNLA